MLLFYLGVSQEMLCTGLTQNTRWAASAKVGFNSLSFRRARACRDVQAPSAVNREKQMALQSCLFLSTDREGIQDVYLGHPTFHTSVGAADSSPCQTASLLPPFPGQPQSGPPLPSEISALCISSTPCHLVDLVGVYAAEHRGAVLTGLWFPNTKPATKLN